MTDAWAVRDWRLRVADLYAGVRGESDPRAAHRLWVAGRGALLREHPASPVPDGSRASFTPEVAPYDPAWRFRVPVRATEPQRWDVPTVTDGVVPFERIGRVELPVGDLDVWWLGSYGGGVFLPVRDSSSRTYGGGRYLLDTVKGADLGGTSESIVVDLNFAYQPSCAYSPDWVCPLAGPGNTLAHPVEAGELYVPV